MIIFYQDQQQIPNQRKVNLALNVDLPKIIGLISSKATNRFNRRQASALQMILDQYSTNCVLMD